MSPEEHELVVRASFQDRDGEKHNILIGYIIADDDDEMTIWSIFKALGNNAIGVQVRATGRLTFKPYISNTTGEVKCLLELLLQDLHLVLKANDELPLRLRTIYENGQASSLAPITAPSASSTEIMWP